MTPSQIAAELAAISSSVEAALDDEHADRQHILGITSGRVQGLAERVRRSGNAPCAGLRPDGPHSDGYTTELADVFAAAVRVLNHATGPHADTGLTYPATAYSVTGYLAAGTHGLGQLTRQVMTFLDRELAAGRLGDDTGRPPALAVERARSHADDAARLASALSAAFAAIQNELSPLHGTEGGRS